MGSLTPGKGNRLVLANTEELHEKIDTLCSRIRELECALQTARGSDQGQHPIVEKEAASNDATNTNSTAGSEPALTNHNSTSSNVSSPPGSDQPSSDQVADKDEESFVDSFGMHDQFFLSYDIDKDAFRHLNL
ncbi:hypothetical protein H0H93_003787 [Arthromyces matolae]|nr:hypothetical protein H0H93_003787 [Arthromyces matolae]